MPPPMPPGRRQHYAATPRRRFHACYYAAADIFSFAFAAATADCRRRFSPLLFADA